MKRIFPKLIFLFLLVFFTAVFIPRLCYISESSRLSEDLLFSDSFRRQKVSGKAESHIRTADDPGEFLGIWWLETDFGKEREELSVSEISSRRKRWELKKGWKEYLGACRAVWDDLVYFPVAQSSEKKMSVTFEDSWMLKRSYKGERGHEGTDIMPSVNERGLFPVVSMTDGTVENMGWLELGGWRIGVRAPHGAYFYYAHLDSYADLKVGDQIKAGDLIGYMGDTGYSKKEGMTGKFPVHIHLGIYLEKDGKEISVNPYSPLKYVEDKRIRARF